MQFDWPSGLLETNLATTVQLEFAYKREDSDVCSIQIWSRLLPFCQKGAQLPPNHAPFFIWHTNMSQVGFLANGRSARVLVQVFEMPMTRNIFSFFFFWVSVHYGVSGGSGLISGGVHCTHCWTSQRYKPLNYISHIYLYWFWIPLTPWSLGLVCIASGYCSQSDEVIKCDLVYLYSLSCHLQCLGDISTSEQTCLLHI